MLTYKVVPRLNFEELRTFVAVVELGSFSLAADSLCRTTAAVSYRMRCLENSLGVALFDRHARGVKLTRAGDWLYGKARDLLLWQQHIPDEINAVKNGVESRFTLIINNLLYDAVSVAELIQRIKERYTYTQIKVVRSVFNGVWDSLIYDEGSLAIGTPSFHSLDQDFLTHPLGVIDWHLVASPLHPLAKKDCVTENDLKPYPVVNIEDSSFHMPKRMPWRLIGQDEILVPDLRTKMACHINGVGVGFLPFSMIKDHLHNGRLVELKTSEPLRASSPMALGWSKNNDGQVSQWVRSLIINRDAIVSPLLEPISNT